MQVGGTTTFSVAFTSTTGTATDPTVITFLLREGIDGTEREWTYNAVPIQGTHYPTGTNPIVRDSAGAFHVVYVTRKPERHVGFWRGTGTVNQSSQVTVFVAHSDVVLVEP
jgi:hypothetical protein